MKKQLIALAVGAAFCGLAQADGGVTLSGSLDVGVMSASKARNPQPGNPTNTGSVVAIQDGAITPSTYTISGFDTISPELKATFNLTGGFNVGTGHNNSPGLPVNQGQLFGEQAYAGLEGGWGSAKVGLQLDPAFIAAISTEPRGMPLSFSSADFWILFTAFNGPTGTGLPSQPTGQALQGGIFDANSVSYSWAGNGLSIGALYGFGGVAGSMQASSQYSIGASYTNSGITGSAGYVVDKANIGQGTAVYYTGDASKIWFAGLGYAFGAFAVRAQYQDFQAAFCATGTCGTAGANVKDWGIGVDWKSGANTLNLAFYDAKDDGAENLVGGVFIPNGGKTTEVALLDSYALSKRTSVFGQIASVKVDSQTASSGPGSSGALGGIYTPVGLTAVTGATTTFLEVGMILNF